MSSHNDSFELPEILQLDQMCPISAVRIMVRCFCFFPSRNTHTPGSKNTSPKTFSGLVTP